MSMLQVWILHKVICAKGLEHLEGKVCTVQIPGKLILIKGQATHIKYISYCVEKVSYKKEVFEQLRQKKPINKYKFQIYQTQNIDIVKYINEIKLQEQGCINLQCLVTKNLKQKMIYTVEPQVPQYLNIKWHPYGGNIGAVTVAQWSSLFPESYHSYTAFLAVEHDFFRFQIQVHKE